MGASISTIIGLVIAIATLRHLYVEKKQEIEYDTKKAFYDGRPWTNEGVVDGKETVFFDLLIDNGPLHNLSGRIDDYESRDEVDIIYFHFESVKKRTITLDIYKMSENQMYTEGKAFTRSLGKATVKYVEPDFFMLTFIGDCMQNLPRKTAIFSWSDASQEETI